MAVEYFTAADEGAPKEPMYLNVLLVGPEGAGKTHHAKTWPTPSFFLCSSREKGVESLDSRFDAARCSTYEDFRSELDRIFALVANKKFVDRKGRRYKTFVLEGAKFFGEMIELWAKKQAGGDGRKLFSLVGWACQEIFGQIISMQGIHTLITTHPTEAKITMPDGTKRTTGYKTDIVGGIWGDMLPKMVFGRIWNTWVVPDFAPGEPQPAPVVRSYLRPHGFYNASMKLDGSLGGTGYVLPAYEDNLTFGRLADLMTLCGHPVHDAPLDLQRRIAELEAAQTRQGGG